MPGAKLKLPSSLLEVRLFTITNAFGVVFPTGMVYLTAAALLNESPVDTIFHKMQPRYAMFA